MCSSEASPVLVRTTALVTIPSKDPHSISSILAQDAPQVEYTFAIKLFLYPLAAASSNVRVQFLYVTDIFYNNNLYQVQTIFLRKIRGAV